MIQLVINTNMLREIDERKLINTYARLFYDSEEDVTNDVVIRNNLDQLFDWDINGDNGLGIYCSKFEKIKRKDWDKLVQFIKENHHEIKNIASGPRKARRLESIKIINDAVKAIEKRNKDRCLLEDYEVSGRGKKAKTCIYEGREYQSRLECRYKENLTKNQLYRYLKATNQL